GRLCKRWGNRCLLWLVALGGEIAIRQGSGCRSGGGVYDPVEELRGRSGIQVGAVELQAGTATSFFHAPVLARRPSIGYAGSLKPGVEGWPLATRRSIRD